MLHLESATYSALMSLSGADVGLLVLPVLFVWLLSSEFVDELVPSAGMSLSGALWFWELVGAAPVAFVADPSGFVSAAGSSPEDASEPDMASSDCSSVVFFFVDVATPSSFCLCPRELRRTGERAANAASTMAMATTVMVFFEGLFVICLLLSIGLRHG